MSTEERNRRRHGRIRSSNSSAGPFFRCFCGGIMLLLMMIMLLGGDSGGVLVVSAEEEVTWTPNNDPNGGGNTNLPLSSEVRQQLFQLEEAIQSSPDPQATLNEVAKNNNMSPEDLVGMLQRNRSDRDHVQGGSAPPGGGGGGSRRRSVLTKVVSSMVVVISQSATKHPKSFVLMCTLLLLIGMISFNIPRNGVVLSKRKAAYKSTGPTTFFAPPTHYITKLIEHPPSKWVQYMHLPADINDTKSKKKGSSSSSMTEMSRIHLMMNENNQVFDELVDSNPTTTTNAAVDGGRWHGKFPKKSSLLQAASYQIVIPIDILSAGPPVPTSPPPSSRRKKAAAEEQATTEEGELQRRVQLEQEQKKHREDIAVDIAFDHAMDVLARHTLAEFVPSGNQHKITFQTARRSASSNHNNRRRQQQQQQGPDIDGIFVLKKLGDYNRYGLLPLQCIQSLETQSSLYKVYNFVNEAAWVGQLHIKIQKEGAEDLDEDPPHEQESHHHLRVQVSLLFPKKTHRILQSSRGRGSGGGGGGKLWKHAKLGSASKKVALTMVESISKSIASSIRTRTRQSLARSMQSKSFYATATQKALQRRTTRYDKIKDMEEMATDRRRKWQRANPDSGSRYRPSGHRMKSPKNAMY